MLTLQFAFARMYQRYRFCVYIKYTATEDYKAKKVKKNLKMRHTKKSHVRKSKKTKENQIQRIIPLTPQNAIHKNHLMCRIQSNPTIWK